jgi:predicted transposase YbfD/YdcC
LVAVCLLSSCTNKTSSLDMVDLLPAYRGAYDIDKRIIERESNQQLFYRLKKSYPSVDVLNYYDQYFMEQGWIKCSGNMETWESFVDATQRQKQLIHQIARYWIKKPENKLSMVYLRYNSETVSAHVPDNSIQNVFILMQRDIDNLETELSRLSLDCDYKNKK